MTFLRPLRCQLSVHLWGLREDKKETERVHGKDTSTSASCLVPGVPDNNEQRRRCKKGVKERCEDAKRQERDRETQW